METTGNQNVDLNSQLGTIVATHPHLQLNQSILWCTRARASRGSASHVFLVVLIVSITRTSCNWIAVIGQLRCARVNQVH